MPPTRAPADTERLDNSGHPTSLLDADVRSLSSLTLYRTSVPFRAQSPRPFVGSWAANHSRKRNGIRHIRTVLTAASGRAKGANVSVVDGTELSALEVSSAVLRVLDVAVSGCEHLAGYANDNWKVTTPDGERYVAKFGPISHEAKWRSAHAAHTVALQAGLPVAPPVHFGVHNGGLMRVFEWIDGITPTPRTIHGDGGRRLFSDLGFAVGALQAIGVDAFSSRFDGSAPSFAAWADYIAYRLAAVRARCETTEALDDKTLRRATELIEDLAQTVTDAACPTLVHRDLYAENLLVDRDGHLVGILDFDTSEVWDAAGEWFKLNWLLFPSFPDAETTFAEAYWASCPPAENWAERIRLEDLIETLNVIPNAIVQEWHTMEIDARRRLSSILD